MAIPKNQLSLIIELMEALPLDGTVYEMPQQVEFIPHDEIYIGFFDTTIIYRMQGLGIITLLGGHDDERQAVKLNERDDFLASWSAGVNEARNGSDLHYAD
ncbi:hypothetical protein ND926_19010 [Vibrio diabolicus]|uniref:hypothetical protein n=1 Tax=Vibrio diabolicus TaxID=50719 RepID=UPI00216028D8|nr:hypothetical protein [Vibrio diabolicus]MCS0339548.1 hypothetical protein [Vibrio diabolicus]